MAEPFEIHQCRRTECGLELTVERTTHDRGFRVTLSWDRDAKVVAYWDVPLEPHPDVTELDPGALSWAELVEVERWVERDAYDALYEARLDAREDALLEAWL